MLREGRSDPCKDPTSVMSASCELANKFNLDARFGNKTLSSLAFPIFELGSSCSRNMLNLADRLGISRLVRKSLSVGSAVDRSIFGGCSGSGFFLKNCLENIGTGGASDGSGPSPRFLRLRKRFMAAVGSVCPCYLFLY